MSATTQKAAQVQDEFMEEMADLQRALLQAQMEEEECAEAGDHRGRSVAAAAIEVAEEDIAALPDEFALRYNLYRSDRREFAADLIQSWDNAFESPIEQADLYNATEDEWFFPLGSEGPFMFNESGGVMDEEIEENLLAILSERYENGDYDEYPEERLAVARSVRDRKLH